MAYVDPRTKPTPPWKGPSRAPAASVTDVAPLIKAFSDGRIYDAETWIAAGKPLQFVYPENGRKSPNSPLQSAIWSAGYDAALLLLCNGYRLDLERRSPLTEALKAKSLDVVKLLLDWGADPHDVDANAVVSCYDAAIVEDFWRRGLDFSDDNALAGALAHATSNRPLYGFMKSHAAEDPALQRELDRGLSFAVDNQLFYDESSAEKAVHLCIWAGADPWHCVPIPYEQEENDDDADEWSAGECAAGRAVYHRRANLILPMKLKSASPHFQALYEVVRDRATYDALVGIEPPRNPAAVVEAVLRSFAWDRSLDRPTDSGFLVHLLEAGPRVDQLNDPAPHFLREYLLGSDGGTARTVIRVLQDPEHVERSFFLRIVASAPFVRRRRELGITRESLKALAELRDAPESVRAAARRELRGAAEAR